MTKIHRCLSVLICAVMTCVTLMPAPTVQAEAQYDAVSVDTVVMSDTDEGIGAVMGTGLDNINFAVETRTYENGSKEVTISCDVKGAEILYSLAKGEDGVFEAIVPNTPYTGPIFIAESGSYMLRFRAYMNGEYSGVYLRKNPINVTIVGEPSTKITVYPSAVTLRPGETYRLVAELSPYSGSVQWSSSDSSVVTVSADGKLTAVDRGRAQVTAKSAGASKSCTVTVSPTFALSEFDFSEWNMMTNTSYLAVDSSGNYDGYNSNPIMDGGNVHMAAAYLAKWDGAVLESDDPYPTGWFSSNDLQQEYLESNYNEVDPVMLISDVVFAPYRQSALDNDDIKRLLVQYGVVASSYQDNDNYLYDEINYCYPSWQKKSDDDFGHAVAIVGWDDNYPASNFNGAASGDGAFICKNSWGDDWGEDGYFYISYYDEYLGYEAEDDISYVVNYSGAPDYNKIYQYDPLGETGWLTYETGRELYQANVYPEAGRSITSDETLKAVGFYTHENNLEYEVYVVTNYTGSSSLKSLGKVRAGGIMADMGYHTVSLDEPVLLKAGSRFAVVVLLKYKNGFKFNFEYPAPHTSNARANKGEGFYKLGTGSWTDLAVAHTNSSICLKAFTSTSDSSVLIMEAIDNEARVYESDKTFSIEETVVQGIQISPSAWRYMDLSEEQLAMLQETYIPSKASSGLSEGFIFPERFDLREHGEVSSVKNQLDWGSCWAHAAYATLEGVLLRQARTAAAPAEEEPPMTVGTLEIKVPTVTAKPGEYIEVPIDITENSGIAGAAVQLNFDGSQLTPDEIILGPAFVTGTMQSNLLDPGTDKTGLDHVTMVYKSLFDTKAVGTFFTVRFRVNEAAEGESALSLSYNDADIYDQEHNYVMAAVTNGRLVVVGVPHTGDYTINSLEGIIPDSGTFYAEVSVTKNTDRDDADVIVIAVYRGNVLEEIAYMRGSFNEGQTMVFGSRLNAVPGATLKAFVWDELSNMLPLSEAMEK
ncbi:MAG: Ig-like domain-containing protein [Oscillospiraceae bacterium]|nr:Ig-like domain-containing protein [Oscillospiraceae bacterium]